MAKNVLIIGAGFAGELLKNDIEKNMPEINIIGFVDDNKTSKLPIIGSISDINKLNEIYKIDEMIIAIPSAQGGDIRKILLNSLENRTKIKLVPRNLKIINENSLKYSDVTDIDLQDFLGRPFVKGEVENLHKIYKDKTILITGGAGSIGSEIVHQLVDIGAKRVIVYDSSEYLTFLIDQRLKEKCVDSARYRVIIGNILNKEKLDKIIKEEAPDVIFHAAAYKHVYLMEDNIDEAVTNNLVGTKNVVDCAIENNIKDFIFISTDKVVNPTSIMGSTKKLAEYYIKHVNFKNTKFNIVRFGNVINSNGSVLPLFEYQLQKYKYLTITHKDIKRFFMSIREASQLVISSLLYNSSGEIYILNMGELIYINEIALCLIRSKNLLPNVDIEMKYIGLKKGEKMVEELFTQNEIKNLETTVNSNIFRLKNFEKCKEDINLIFAKFESMVNNNASQNDLRKYFEHIFSSLIKKGK